MCPSLLLNRCSHVLFLTQCCCLAEGLDTKVPPVMCRIMKAMLPLMTVLERGGKFVQCVKYGCELDGLPSGGVRLPLRPMTKELKRQFRDALITARTTIGHLVADSKGDA